MKRKRSDEDEDDAASAAMASTTAGHHDAPPETLNVAPNLTTLADDIIRSVLSYFDFYERSKLRLVCRQMRDVVDAMPSPPDSLLEIQLESWTADESHQRPWTITCNEQTSTVRLIIRIPRNVTFPLGSASGGTFRLQGLPRLNKIRPAHLRIDGDLCGRATSVNVTLLNHLANEGGESVADLSIGNLAPEPLGELQEALGKFEHLTKLHLSTLFPLVDTVSITTSIHNLTSLELTLRREMVPEFVFECQRDNLPQVGLHLSALSSLPNLRELGIRVNHEVLGHEFDQSGEDVASFMRGCASIPKLECLSSGLLDDRQDGSRNAFAVMLRQLPALTDLSILYCPTTQLWRMVHGIGGHQHLRTLSIYYYFEGTSTVEHLQSMVVACNQCFPSLAELELHFSVPDYSSEIVRVLAGLKSHQSLSVVKCGWDSEGDGGATFFKELREELGGSMGVLEIPHYNYDE